MLTYFYDCKFLFFSSTKNKMIMIIIIVKSFGLSLKRGFGGCDGLADSADSTDSADLTGSDFNWHLDRLGYF